MLRETQVEVLRAFLQGKEDSWVHQMLMGGGKTCVIAPISAALLATPSRLFVAIVPSSLLTFSRSQLRARLCNPCLGVPVLTFDFSRETRVTSQLLHRLQHARRKRSAVCASPQSIKHFQYGCHTSTFLCRGTCPASAMAPVEEITTTEAPWNKRPLPRLLTSHAELKVDGVCHDVCRIMAKFLNSKSPPSPPESDQEGLLLPDWKKEQAVQYFQHNLVIDDKFHSNWSRTRSELCLAHFRRLVDSWHPGKKDFWKQCRDFCKEWAGWQSGPPVCRPLSAGRLNNYLTHLARGSDAQEIIPSPEMLAAVDRFGIRVTDIRLTSESIFKFCRDWTGLDWRAGHASDPCPWPVPQAFNGLLCSWKLFAQARGHNRVYLNPPWSHLDLWLRKAAMEYATGLQILIVVPRWTEAISCIFSLINDVGCRVRPPHEWQGYGSLGRDLDLDGVGEVNLYFAQLLIIGLGFHARLGLTDFAKSVKQSAPNSGSRIQFGTLLMVVNCAYPTHHVSNRRANCQAPTCGRVGRAANLDGCCCHCDRKNAEIFECLSQIFCSMGPIALRVFMGVADQLPSAMSAGGQSRHTLQFSLISGAVGIGGEGTKQLPEVSAEEALQAGMGTGATALIDEIDWVRKATMMCDMNGRGGESWDAWCRPQALLQEIVSRFTQVDAVQEMGSSLHAAFEAGVREHKMMMKPNPVVLDRRWYYVRLLPLLATELASFLGPRTPVPREELLSFFGPEGRCGPTLTRLPDAETKLLTLGRQLLHSAGISGPDTHEIPTCQKLCPPRQPAQQLDSAHVAAEHDGLCSTQSQLAVPFIGKDCPSTASEFAHPDVAIGLTLLAYRYEGLRKQDFLLLLKQKWTKREGHTQGGTTVPCSFADFGLRTLSPEDEARLDSPPANQPLLEDGLEEPAAKHVADG
ncbi:CML12 [Symbiodinium microadriaticum]|nr:CML12 [Symbiodinium microadriaticum]